jgi:hypothetical protein
VLCNICTANTRDEKVASVDAQHMQAWKAVAAMLPKLQMLKWEYPEVSVHELSVHIHGGFLGTVHVRVRFVPENGCCTVVHG